MKLVTISFVIMSALISGLVFYVIGRNNPKYENVHLPMNGKIAVQCMKVCEVETFHVNRDWVTCQCKGKSFNIGHPNN